MQISEFQLRQCRNFLVYEHSENKYIKAILYHNDNFDNRWYFWDDYVVPTKTATITYLYFIVHHNIRHAYMSAVAYQNSNEANAS